MRMRMQGTCTKNVLMSTHMPHVAGFLFAFRSARKLTRPKTEQGTTLFFPSKPEKLSHGCRLWEPASNGKQSAKPFRCPWERARSPSPPPAPSPPPESARFRESDAPRTREGGGGESGGRRAVSKMAMKEMDTPRHTTEPTA